MKLLFVLLVLFTTGLFLTPKKPSSEIHHFRKYIPMFYGTEYYPKLPDVNTIQPSDSKRNVLMKIVDTATAQPTRNCFELPIW